MVFDSNDLKASSMMKGLKVKITQQFLTDVIVGPNEGIKCYFSHKEIPYEGYSREGLLGN